VSGRLLLALSGYVFTARCPELGKATTW